MKPEISIVIPSYKPGVLLFRLLDSLRAQSFDLPKEILVVDSSPEPFSPEERKRYPEVRFVHLPRRTLPGRARSIGAEMANGRILFFTDTDCAADPYWLKRLWEVIRQGYPVAGGSVVNGTPRSYIGTTEYLLEFNETNPGMKSREVRALPSCNLAVEKRIFQEVGFFPDFMKGEDTIFCDRIFLSGGKILFVPEAKITHLNRTDFWKFLKNQIALGEGAIETRKQTRRHGYFLVHCPPLVAFIPLYRTLAIAKRFLESDRRLFVQYVWHYPLILLGMLSYTWGFIRGPYRSGLSTEKKT
jgi:GT2 family glycosyltransferase